MDIEYCTDFKKYYRFDKKPLGKGEYGVVKRAWKKDKTDCACKIVKRENDYIREVDHLIYCNGIQGVLPLERVLINSKKLLMQFPIGVPFNKVIHLDAFLDFLIISDNEASPFEQGESVQSFGMDIKEYRFCAQVRVGKI